jgi:hypothetical protein
MLPALICLLSLSISWPCEGVQQSIDWAGIRGAFRVYCESPSAENANQVLSLLPKEFDNNAVDLEQWSSTSHYIEGGPLKTLRNLIQKGDKFAIRIAFRTLVISDGGFAEILCELPGQAISVNPIAYLEEANTFYQDVHRSKMLLDTVAPSYYGSPGADFEVYRNEIQARIKALETVTRPDLLNMRENCIRELERAWLASVRSVEWVRFRDALTVFGQSPSADNADRVLAAFPEEIEGRNGRSFNQLEYMTTLDDVFSGVIFRALAALAHQGNRPCLRVAFRLLVVSEGLRRDALCSLIGRTIRVNPLTFLEETKTSGIMGDLLDSVLARNIDAIEQGFPEIVKREIELRIAALETVTRPDLLELRKTCVSKLRQRLKIYEGF